MRCSRELFGSAEVTRSDVGFQPLTCGVERSQLICTTRPSNRCTVADPRIWTQRTVRKRHPKHSFRVTSFGAGPWRATVEEMAVEWAFVMSAQCEPLRVRCMQRLAQQFHL